MYPNSKAPTSWPDVAVLLAFFALIGFVVWVVAS
jgi:hypothetical protein